MNILNTNDPFYRYKMDAVELIKNKNKYIFTNIDVIAFQLHREPNHIISFLKKTFGVSFDYKNNVAITSKKDLTLIELQQAIYKYIDLFVLCKKM